ncbi:MAG: hypothetical protein M3Y87_06290 [Myxococcota bacterium]|nr:hypothetical protein [Myxococcota bacterium]
MSLGRQAFEAASNYLRRNPQELTRSLWSLLGLRIGVPLDALRWLLERVARSGKVKDPVLTEVPPGMRLTATFDLMNTPVRASAVVYIDRMVITPAQIRIETRLEEIWMEVQGDAQGPVAALLRSGALDLSKPGNLAKYMALPPTVVEARDNRIVVDLMKDPKIAGNRTLQRVLPLITPVVTAYALETDDDHLEVTFRPLPDGLRPAASAIRRHLVRPGMRRIRALLPG